MLRRLRPPETALRRPAPRTRRPGPGGPCRTPCRGPRPRPPAGRPGKSRDALREAGPGGPLHKGGARFRQAVPGRPDGPESAVAAGDRVPGLQAFRQSVPFLPLRSGAAGHLQERSATPARQGQASPGNGKTRPARRIFAESAGSGPEAGTGSEKVTELQRSGKTVIRHTEIAPIDEGRQCSRIRSQHQRNTGGILGHRHRQRTACDRPVSCPLDTCTDQGMTRIHSPLCGFAPAIAVSSHGRC